MGDGRVIQTLAAGQVSAVKAPWVETTRRLAALAQSGPATAVDMGLLLARPATPLKGATAPSVTSRAAIYRVTGTALHNGHRLTALVVVGVQSDVAPQLSTLAGTLETVVPPVLILCVGSGYWLVHRALRPIRTITRIAQEISETNLHQRFNLRNRDELGQLGDTLDSMFARLEAAVARQRQFTADASHELRTPLAIIDLEAARALAHPRSVDEYRRAIGVMQDETAHMTRLVQDLLTLARAESGGISPAAHRG